MQITHKGARKGPLEVRSKIWLEVGGKPVFGRGRRFLLEAIDAHGSINRAAREIEISYRKAWSYIQAMEERLGIPLVRRQKGGRDGGGTVLTDDARVFLEKFRMLEERMRDMADEGYRDLFSKGNETGGRL